MRRLWNKFVAWLLAVPQDKRLHFAAGFAAATFAGMVFGVIWCGAVAVGAGVLKECYDTVCGERWDWLDLLATSLGGVLPEAFALLALLT